ncbi:unnamed protein product [Sphagnum jensenii]|uniref:Uncharacterized protein n=1 Tax=Sphagnum jensenii TaxID=128206 RepID=A0ABP1AH11_9BRYO
MIELYARAQSSKTRLEEEMSSETTKAAAWAVFQHHGGSTNYNRSCGIGVRRATRFKIEAQMTKNHGGGGHSEGLHAGGVATSLCSSSRTVKNHRWDAGSTLFDSYELDSLSKQFDRTFFFQLHQEPSSSCCSSSSHTTPEEELFLSSSSSFSSATTRSLTSCRDEESRRCQSSPPPSFLDTTRMSSPFSRHQSHRDARVLPSERMRDSVEDSYTLEHRCSFQSQGANPMQRPVVSSIDANTAYRDEHHRHHERDEAPTTSIVDGQNATAGASGKSPGRSSVSSCCMEKGAMAEEIQAQKLLHEEEDKEEEREREREQAATRGLQFAGHTPNPLNLSQRKWRSCVDYKSSRSDVSADGGGPMMRQSFQEKLRSFFHKARISPQDSSPHKLGRKSYTGPENSSSSLSSSSSSSPLYGSWSYWNHVDDKKKHNHTPDESDELLYKSHHRHKHRLLSLRKSGREKKLDAAASDPAVAAAAPAVAPTTTTTAASDCHKPQGSKQKKSGSTLFRSVTHALQASLPHFGGGGGGGSESPRHRKSSNVTEHKHHHTIYHHHHVVIHQQQQQQQLQQQQQSEQQLQLEDYELKLQDIIDRRVPRKTFEEHQARRISFEDRK